MVQVVPAITGLIDRLEKSGMVRRRRCEKDRRVIFVEITDEALNLLSEIDEPLKNLLDRLLGHLTRSELRSLIDLLEKARSRAH